MALSGPDTGGSQWFITHSPQPHLDAKYTVFGHVVAGMDVVDKLTQDDTIVRIRVWDGTPKPEPSTTAANSLTRCWSCARATHARARAALGGRPAVRGAGAPRRPRAGRCTRRSRTSTRRTPSSATSSGMDVVDKLTQDDTIVRIRVWDGAPRPEPGHAARRAARLRTTDSNSQGTSNATFDKLQLEGVLTQPRQPWASEVAVPWARK